MAAAVPDPLQSGHTAHYGRRARKRRVRLAPVWQLVPTEAAVAFLLLAHLLAKECHV